MLLLPSVSIADCEIRLPIENGSCLDLCRTLDNRGQFRSILPSTFGRSPGLLAYSLSRWQQIHQNSCCNIDQIVNWLWDHSVFDLGENESRAKTATVSKNIVRRIDRYRRRPSLKRLAKFLSAASGQSWIKMADWISEVADAEFGWAEIPVNQENVDSFVSPVELDKWAIACWEICSQLQALRQSFANSLQRQKMESLKELAYGASHEINNPLANIATRAQTLLASETLWSKREKLTVIYAQAMRAHEMISDMMLFARPPKAEFVELDLRELVQSLVKSLRPEIRAAGVEVVIRQYPDVVRFDFDPTQLKVALEGMIRNSLFYLHSGGKICVQIYRSSESEIGLAVVDDGPGIPDSIADSVFDPFFSGREAGRGLGFGLSKAWRIAEAHCGELVLDRNYQHGARFVMRLPLNPKKSIKSNDFGMAARIDNRLVA